MLLVEAKDRREELRELFFQPLTGKQVAHGTKSRHHGEPELKGQQEPPCLLPARSPEQLPVHLCGNYSKRPVGHGLRAEWAPQGPTVTRPQDQTLEQADSDWM